MKPTLLPVPLLPQKPIKMSKARDGKASRKDAQPASGMSSEEIRQSVESVEKGGKAAISAALHSAAANTLYMVEKISTDIILKGGRQSRMRCKRWLWQAKN
jgi:hypothetical protein